MSKNTLFPLLAFLLLLSIWEFGSLFFVEMRLVLPAPSNIIARIAQQPDRFLFHTEKTFKTMMGGFLLAFILAFPLAWLMSRWLSARLMLQPLFVIIQCVPMFALAPIMVIWFGWTYTAIVIPTAIMIFFPLTMNIYQGLHATPKDLLDYFKCNQATTWQLFCKLQLPWALPQIFSGFRIAAAIAGIGAIAGEWAGAQEGLGVLMLESRRGADLEMTFGALTCLTVLSLSLYGGILLIEKMTLNRSILRLLQRVPAYVLIGLGCVLQSCQSADSESTKETQTRLMLDWLPNPNHVPFYVGLDQGFFANEGISLKILKIQDPSDPLAYLSSGLVDIAISYMPSVIQAMSHGAPLQAIGILIDEPLNAIIYRSDLGISTPADLNGKIIGYSVDGSGTKILDELLSVNHITLKEKHNVSFDLVSMIGTKRVDALYGAFWNIECEQLRSLGIQTDYFTLTELGMPTYYELIAMAKKGTQAASPEFENKFQRALQNSIDFCLKAPEEAFEIYLRYNPDKGKKVVDWERQAWIKTLPALARQQVVDPVVWETYARWLHNVTD